MRRSWKQQTVYDIRVLQREERIERREEREERGRKEREDERYLETR